MSAINNIHPCIKYNIHPCIQYNIHPCCDLTLVQGAGAGGGLCQRPGGGVPHQGHRPGGHRGSRPQVRSGDGEYNVIHCPSNSFHVAEADKIAMTHERTEPVLLDVNERPDLLDDLIKSHNIVVSLLPWQLHPSIAAR